MLPFAFSTSSVNEKNLLNTDPRERHVIDENAGSMYHTRGVTKIKRETGLIPMPSLKRKMGASFNEKDDIKRRDHDFFFPGSSEPQLDTDPDVTSTNALPSSPPVLPHMAMSEYDISTSNCTVPDSPVDSHQMMENLNTSPVKRVMQHQSSEADFGIDQFNRFKTSSYILCPSTDTGMGHEAHHRAQYTRARSIIIQAFEDINPAVSLEGMDLTEIPEEIKDLDNLVIFDLPTQALYQLYLTNNRLKSVNPALFKFSKLNVLSLRQNYIQILPSAIGRLTNLTDLNISANRLRYLPPQILTLPNLTTFRAGPNPFAAIPSDAISVDEDESDRRLKYISPVVYHRNSTNTVPALKALCLNAVARYDVTYRETRSWKKNTPEVFHQLIARAITNGKFENVCNECNIIPVEPHAEVYEWWDILQNKNVPVRRDFCSGKCAHEYERRNQKHYST